jgi:hypothetical protein
MDTGEEQVSHSWGHLKPNTPFAHIFPDGRVPLRGPLPIIPREVGAPPCYLVPGRELTEAQIQALAEMLWQTWQPECTSIAEAATYIREDALPLRQEWFSNVATDMRIFI